MVNILNEPINGLDSIDIQEMREMIRSFQAQGITLVISSHILAEVQQVVTHIGRVHPVAPASLYLGKVLALGLWNAISALFFMALVLAAGSLCAGNTPAPFRQILEGAELVCIATLPVLILQLWIAGTGGYAPAIIAGLLWALEP